MTLNELRANLLKRHSLEECDVYLRGHFDEIRPIFYGLTSAELHELRFEYEDVFLEFTNSKPMLQACSDRELPHPILALLIFFLSLFERAGLYSAIGRVADMLPAGALRDLAEAMFKYKYITDASRNHIDRFDGILGLVNRAWVGGSAELRAMCECVLSEYALDALLNPYVSQVHSPGTVQAMFKDNAARGRYGILKQPCMERILSMNTDPMEHERVEVRARIVEALYLQACAMAPESLALADAEVAETCDAPAQQRYDVLPAWLDDELLEMGAIYRQRPEEVRMTSQWTHERNREYLGTYFPRTVIEARNIVGELLTIPAIANAMAIKDHIRILDLGSGTGGAVVGTLLALSDWGRCNARVEVKSIDANADSLTIQRQILACTQQTLSLTCVANQKRVILPSDIDGFATALNGIAVEEGPSYDFVLCWKCLSEFYNASYALAYGIVSRTLRVASCMLTPCSVCIVADLTSRDNKHRYFPNILNEESNGHDASPEAIVHTVLPLPCGRASSRCHDLRCYSQRQFAVRHQLSRVDKSKIAYRVFAPTTFAQRILSSFTKHSAYCVSQAGRAEACFDGQRAEVPTRACYPCGYTGFFAKEN